MRGLMSGVPLALVFALAQPQARACSAFVVVAGGKVIVAGNGDTSYSRNFKIWFTPKKDDDFGRVCIGFDQVAGWSPVAMGGMNEAGLILKHTVTPRTRTPYNPNKPHFRYNFAEKIIAECATVKQAVAMIQAYTLPQEHNAHVHLLLADAAGDSAVIEWVDDEVKIIPRNGPFQLITNFLLSNPQAGMYPSRRFTTGTQMLSALGEPSSENLVPILKEIAQYGRVQGEEVGTVYSTICDLKAGEMYLYYHRDFKKPLKLNLARELAKGPHSSELSALFPNPEPDDMKWKGDK